MGGRRERKKRGWEEEERNIEMRRMRWVRRGRRGLGRRWERKEEYSIRYIIYNI